VKRASRFFIVFLFFITPAARGHAQLAPYDSARALIARGHTLRARGTDEGRSAALRLYEQAGMLLTAPAQRLQRIDVLYASATTAAEMSDFRRAVHFYRRGIALAREISDPGWQGRLLAGVGTSQIELGQPDSALATLRQSLAVVREVEDEAALPALLTALGVAHEQLGRPDSTLLYHRKAISRARPGSDDLRVSLNNLGQLYADLGRPDSARIYFAGALAIPGGRDAHRAGTLGSLAFTYQVLNQPDSALAYFRKGLELARRSRELRVAATLEANLGFLYQQLGDTVHAAEGHRRSIAILEGYGDTVAMAAPLHNLGVLYQLAGQPDSALAYLVRARTLARLGRDRWTEAGTLQGLAEANLFRPVPRLALARAYFDSASAARAALALHAGGDANRVAVAEGAADLHTAWAMAELRRAPELGERGAALAALGAVERGRGVALLQLLRGTGADAVRLSAADTLAGADPARGAEALLREVQAGGAAVLSYLVTRDTVFTWLALPSGSVTATRAPLADVPLERTVRTLRAGIFADEPGRGRGAARGDTTRAGLAGEAGAALGRLSTLLLPPQLATLPPGAEIVIVPHDALGLVPFAALYSGARGGDGPVPLGIRYALRYTPSLATLAALQARPARLDGPGRAALLRRALVVGDPEMPRDPGNGLAFDSLPRSRAEAGSVAALLGAPVLLGPAAREDEVRRRMGAAPLVHLATHGVAYASDERVRESLVVLAPNPGASPPADGLLTMGELLDDAGLRLSADLVVLSACETGLGSTKRAEGTVGIQRAFVARGARSVLGSLWRVRDDTTEQLMRAFYRHWLHDGVTRPEALRRAQAELRARHPNPHDWAAFQLVGAP
jgi:tetratricopeptide (TPR) repeat protein